MRVYEGRDNHSRNSCSYCREPGHNITICPHVVPDWASWLRMEVPLKDPKCWVYNSKMTGNRGHWYIYPRYWGEWYQASRDANEKQEKARAKKNVATPVVRRASKCGFCAGTDHNRRKCAEMLVFREKANRANQAFRRLAYDRIVTEHGLSAGALVEVISSQYDYSTGSHEPKSLGVCTVTSISWDTMSITSDPKSLTPPLSYELRTPILVEFVTGDGRKRSINLNLDYIVALPDSTVSKYNRGSISQVISPSPTPLDEQWVQDGRQDAFDWLAKKKSLFWLKANGVVGLVDKWAEVYKQKGVTDETNK